MNEQSGTTSRQEKKSPKKVVVSFKRFNMGNCQHIKSSRISYRRKRNDNKRRRNKTISAGFLWFVGSRLPGNGRPDSPYNRSNFFPRIGLNFSRYLPSFVLIILALLLVVKVPADVIVIPGILALAVSLAIFIPAEVVSAKRGDRRKGMGRRSDDGS